MLTPCYGKIQVLYHLNLKVHAGELVCLLGGNASGKSTTLKTILGIVRPKTGSVFLKGEDISKKTDQPHHTQRGFHCAGKPQDLSGHDGIWKTWRSGPCSGPIKSGPSKT